MEYKAPEMEVIKMKVAAALLQASGENVGGSGDYSGGEIDD